MGLLGGIWLALLGVLAAPSLLLSRRPDAKEVLAKIAPYQGWIGLISALWGAWGVLNSLLHLGWIARWPIYWATYLAGSVLLLALGALLGVGVAKTFVKDPAAQKRMDETVSRLAPYQARLGLAAIIVGAWMVVSTFIFRIG